MNGIFLVDDRLLNQLVNIEENIFNNVCKLVIYMFKYL